MKIIYFTTAQDEKDYRSFINEWKISLNPSNQNFHNKLIRALAVNNDVHVISVRPFSRSNMKVSKLPKEVKQDGNITWHYVKRNGNKFYRAFITTSQIMSTLKSIDLTDSIFITDTINRAIVTAVYKIKAKYHRPVLGICTDSPSNISGTKRSYTLHLLKHTKEYDGYLALTEGLNNLFNPEGKPSYIFEGIVEDRKFENVEEKPYIFFGGALMEKYGVYNLIDAFKELNRKDIELWICGHHRDKAKLNDAIKNHANIKFLGLLPVNQVMEYEQSALCLVNPRPFSEDLDRFSIPSKTLEYMAMGRPVISVRNTILMNKFKDELIWIPSASKKDILEGINKVLAMTEVERENFGEEAKNRVLELYSVNSIAKNMQSFLLNFLK